MVVQVVHEAFTLTLGDQGENEISMETIGAPAINGISVKRLRQLNTNLSRDGNNCEFKELGQSIQGIVNESLPDAAVLIVRGGVNTLLQDSNAMVSMLDEFRTMPKDKTKLNIYGKVVNSIARHNNTMADYSQPPDISNGKGTVVNFRDYPTTDKLRTVVSHLLDAPLVGELNHYYDAAKCGIDFHGAMLCNQIR